MDLFDTHWIEEFEKIVEHKMFYPPEPMHSVLVRAFFLERGYISNVSTRRVILTNNVLAELGNAEFWKDIWFEGVDIVSSADGVAEERRKLEERARFFFLTDVCVFNVDMAVENMDDFERLSYGDYFRVFNGAEWLDGDGGGSLRDSVFIFHPVNAFYFVFDKMDGVAVDILGKGDVDVRPVVGVLRGCANLAGRGGSSGGKTKRVHFGGDLSSSSSSDEDDDSLDDGGGQLFGGNWLRMRRRRRRKTEKRKNIFTPGAIRSLFEN